MPDPAPDSAVVEPQAPEPPAPETSPEAAAPAPAAPAQPPVFDKILEHQASIQRTLEGMAPQQPQQPAEPAAAPAAQPSGDDLEAAARALLGGQDPDDDGYLPDEGINPAALVGLIQQTTRQAAQEAAAAAIQPIQQQQRVDQLVSAFDALEDDLPRLQELEVRNAVIQRAADAAEQIGRPELLTDPRFFRLAYDAWAGTQGVESTPPDPVNLESAGGATPAAPGEGDPAEQMGDAIVGAARGSKGNFDWGFGVGGG